MKINHDRSYLDSSADAFVPHGLAENRPHSIRISFEYTEAQRAENAHFAETHTPPEWNARCNQHAKARSEYIRPVMEAIAEKFGCYQYDSKRFFRYGSPDWDLFFWCNDFYSTTNGAVTGRDYSYITLSFNDNHDTPRREEIRRDLLQFLTDHFDGMENLTVTIQYETHFHDAEISKIVHENAAKLDGMKCSCFGIDGRIVKTGSSFIFMKKRARTRGHGMSERDLCLLLWGVEV